MPVFVSVRLLKFSHWTIPAAHLNGFVRYPRSNAADCKPSSTGYGLGFASCRVLRSLSVVGIGLRDCNSPSPGFAEGPQKGRSSSRRDGRIGSGALQPGLSLMTVCLSAVLRVHPAYTASSKITQIAYGLLVCMV